MLNHYGLLLLFPVLKFFKRIDLAKLIFPLSYSILLYCCYFVYLFINHLSGRIEYIDKFMNNISLNKIAWITLRKNKLAFFSFCYILFSLFVALFVVLISPDNSPNANEMHIQIAKKKPLTEIKFLHIAEENEVHSSFLKSFFVGVEKNYKRIPVDYYKKLDFEKYSDSVKSAHSFEK